MQIALWEFLNIKGIRKKIPDFITFISYIIMTLFERAYFYFEEISKIPRGSGNEAAIAAAQKKIEQYQNDREKEAERINYLAEQYRQIVDWADEFGSANNDTKKMILARIIEKITVDRNYHITMTFFTTEDDFLKKAKESAPEMEIIEADGDILRPCSAFAG